MTYYDKWDLAHEFFYNDDGGEHYPRYSACGFYGNRFMSYSTCIGYLTNNKHGERVVLISINNFSNTTAKHLNALSGAANCKEIEVFMEYGDDGRYLTPDKCATRAVEQMEYYAGQKLTQAANRNGFLTAFKSYNALANNFKLSVKLPVKYKKLAVIINDSASVKELKAAAVKRAKLDADNARRKLNKLLKNNTLSELAALAYSNDSELNFDKRADIKKAINPDGESAFVWYDDARGEFLTSKYIHMDKSEGLAALKLWAAGRLRHGLKVGIYTVLEVTDKFVKIGCHKIPVKNLSELAALMGCGPVA